MSALSNYLENVVLDHTLGTSSTAAPASVYLALFTDNPTDAATGTEVTGGSYARTVVTFNAASGGSTSNSAVVTFPTATANWGTITHMAIYDASTAGNMLYHGALATSKTINDTDVFQISAGNLSIALD